MAVTLLQARQRALILLAEAGDSEIASLEPGDGGADTVSTAAQLTHWIGRAVDILARTCAPRPGSGTKALSAGDFSFALSSMTVTGGALWSLRAAKVGSTALEYLSRERMEVHFPTLIADANGTAAYFAQDGEYAFVAPKPSGAVTFTGEGLIVPTAPALDADALPYDDDLNEACSEYAAAMAALSRFEDATTYGRAADLIARFDGRRQRRWLQIPPGFRAFHYPLPPSEAAPVASAAAAAAAAGRGG